MRPILVILALISIVSCEVPPTKGTYNDGVLFGIDTMQKAVKPLLDSMYKSSDSIYKKCSDNNRKFKDSTEILNRKIDSLLTVIRYSDYRSGRIVTKIQYYIDITDARSANKKFFFGWVKRAMRQEK